MRIKICRKEAKESAYWLRLLVDTNSEDFRQEGLSLKKEATELKKIFSIKENFLLYNREIQLIVSVIEISVHPVK